VKPHVIEVPTAPCDDEQPRKLGIWFSERMQATAWRLSPGQRYVARSHPRADSLLLVLRGQGDYLVYGDEQPQPDGLYTPDPYAPVEAPPPVELPKATVTPVLPGSVAMTPSGLFYGLVNTGTEQLAAVVVTAPDPSGSVYTIRQAPGSAAAGPGPAPSSAGR